MTDASETGPAEHPRHGQIGYLQLPALDLAASAAFYEHVLGWRVDPASGGFEAPGMIGQLTTDVPVAAGGPVLWITVAGLWPALSRVSDHGGSVRSRPWLDGGERWLAEVLDPAGTPLGLVAAARTAAAQPLLAVRDVEAASRWYQALLGLVSDHGGPHYERLLADGVLVLQLHHHEVAHHHGAIALSDDAPAGNGALVWLGEVADFDGVVARARDLGVDVVRGPERNPPEGTGNGPSHREIWVRDPDGYLVVIASPDGEAWEGPPA